MAKRLRIIVPVIILVIVGLIVWNVLSHQRHNPPGTIYGNGIIEATEIDISAKVSGKIQELRVDEGDAVRKNQLLATLDSQELAAQVQQSQGNLAAAQANLAALKAGSRIEDIQRAQAQYQAALQARQQAREQLSLIRAGTRSEQIRQLQANVQQAQATLNDAEREFRRLQGLEAEGAAPRQQLDQARTRRDVAAAQLEAARQQLRQGQAGARPQEIAAAQAAYQQADQQAQAAQAALNLARAGARPEDIAAAQARVAQAQGAVNAAQEMLGYTKIYAPTNATVTVKSAEQGELVTPGMPMVRLADLNRVWLRVYVPEPALGKIKLGQRVELTSDTYPDKKYIGRVTEIDSVAQFTPKNVQTQEERVKLVYGVKVTIDNPSHELKPGMPADALIYTEENR